jgi:RNA polymerase sigma factor (sigma-70 family)
MGRPDLHEGDPGEHTFVAAPRQGVRQRVSGMDGRRCSGLRKIRADVKNRAVPGPVLVDVRDATERADVAPLEDLYEEHGARLWRALFLYAGDREVASDAVAEAFAQALRRGDDLRSPERWIWRSAFRIAAGELSRRRRETGDVMETSYQAPEETTELLLALPLLTPKQRVAIVLHYYAGYSLKEVAKVTGSTSSAVGVHLHRGRRRLRELLGDDDG